MTKLIYGTPEYEAVKAESLALFGVISTEQFDVKNAIRARIDYLKQNLRNSGMNGYVLGISGGVDSTAAGRLAQLACEELRAEGYKAQFIAVRLPAGVQFDEEDAQSAVRFIGADKMLTVNIGEAATNLSLQGVSEFEKHDNSLSDFQKDFNKGNLKARLRMAVQYHIGSMYNSQVLGTDHNSEGYTGFYTKWGDGACDLIVLNSLNKTQVRLVAKELGAPEFLWSKVPMAGLEENNPKKMDDDGFGFPYWKLDSFLEGETIDIETEEKIVNLFHVTQHKRKPIISFPS